MDLGGGAASAPVGSSRVVSDLVLGLLDLGFTRKQADDAAIKLKGRADEGVAVEVLLREALRLLRG
jgi:Holliday junction resolvasome RuvABC DNA-binding subunit